MILYKYFKYEHGLKVLQNLELKVTPPNEFNDPFEFCPDYFSTLTEENINRMLQDDLGMKNLFERAVKDGHVNCSFEQFKKNASAGISKVREGLFGIAENENQNHSNEASKEYGLICFTEDEKNLLMWAHYGDQHEGFVIGFLKNHDFMKNVEKVNYNHERPIVDLTQPSPDSLAKAIKLSVLAKSRDWIEEKEWRGMVFLKGLREQVMKNPTLTGGVSYNSSCA